MKPESSLQHAQQPPLSPILHQINPVHALPSYIFKIHCDIVLPSTLGLPRHLFPSSFLPKTTYIVLLFSICATCPTHSHPPWFDHPSNICAACRTTVKPVCSFWRREKYLVPHRNQTLHIFPVAWTLHLTPWTLCSFLTGNFTLPFSCVCILVLSHYCYSVIIILLAAVCSRLTSFDIFHDHWYSVYTVYLLGYYTAGHTLC